MTTQELVTHHWREMRPSLKNRWEQLTDEDLDLVDGDARKLVALVHQKTGDAIPDIESAISDIADPQNAPTASARGEAMEPKRYQRSTFSAEAREFSGTVAAERNGEPTAAEMQTASQWTAETRRLVQRRPKSSAGLAFAIGCAAGLGLGAWFGRTAR